MADQAVKQIRMQHLHVAPWHRRSIWGDMGVLRDSIADHGIIQPLVVRDRKAGGYEIVCGVRRMKAATMAELKTAACLVVELDDKDAIAMQVAENLGRENLHPMDEALYYEELAQHGMDMPAIAKRFQVKKRDVVRRVKLLALGPAARKAFIAGKFDDDAALALATMSDVARQTDVLAALDAGHLQAVEIQSYVMREFSASLDDVPWRKTDAEVDVKAGACSTCHKRSDVQRELFSAETVGLRCLDVGCYRRKMDATWLVRSAAPDVTVLDQDAPSLFIPSAAGQRPVVIRASGMVDADAPCQFMIGHTWREAVAAVVKPDAEKPTEYIARDQDGRPRYLLRESIVGKMVRRSDAAKEQAENAAAADPVKPPAGPNARSESKVRRTVVQQIAERMAAGDFDTWPWVTAVIIEGATARAVSSAAQLLSEAIKGLGIDGLEGKLGLLELARHSTRRARQVATSVLLFDEGDVTAELGPAVQTLASICEVDIPALEREIRKAP